MPEGFRTFDHTGDLGLEVWAATPERLFALAAEALMAQVAEVTPPVPVPEARPPGASIAAAEPLVRIEVSLEGDDEADLFIHWLNTALLEADVRHVVWTHARVTRLSPGELGAVLEGPRLDPRRHTLLREVKAVSHHGLELRLRPPECRARLVLDL